MQYGVLLRRYRSLSFARSCRLFSPRAQLRGRIPPEEEQNRRELLAAAVSSMDATQVKVVLDFLNVTTWQVMRVDLSYSCSGAEDFSDEKYCFVHQKRS